MHLLWGGQILHHLLCQLYEGGLLEIEIPTQKEGFQAMGAFLIKMGDQHQPVSLQSSALASLGMGSSMDLHLFDGSGVDLFQIRGVEDPKQMRGKSLGIEPA